MQEPAVEEAIVGGDEQLPDSPGSEGLLAAQMLLDHETDEPISESESLHPSLPGHGPNHAASFTPWRPLTDDTLQGPEVLEQPPLGAESECMQPILADGDRANDGEGAEADQHTPRLASLPAASGEVQASEGRKVRAHCHIYESMPLLPLFQGPKSISALMSSFKSLGEGLHNAAETGG